MERKKWYMDIEWYKHENCIEPINKGIKDFIISNKYKIGKRLNELGINTYDNIINEFEKIQLKNCNLSHNQREFINSILYQIKYVIVFEDKKLERKEKCSLLTGINKESLIDNIK